MVETLKPFQIITWDFYCRLLCWCCIGYCCWVYLFAGNLFTLDLHETFCVTTLKFLNKFDILKIMVLGVEIHKFSIAFFRGEYFSTFNLDILHKLSENSIFIEINVWATSYHCHLNVRVFIQNINLLLKIDQTLCFMINLLTSATALHFWIQTLSKTTKQVFLYLKSLELLRITLKTSLIY